MVKDELLKVDESVDEDDDDNITDKDIEGVRKKKTCFNFIKLSFKAYRTMKTSLGLMKSLNPSASWMKVFS